MTHLGAIPLTAAQNPRTFRACLRRTRSLEQETWVDQMKHLLSYVEQNIKVRQEVECTVIYGEI